MAHGTDDDTPPPSSRRWPRRVYQTGEEPDPRFTFANERTFLAWIRTSLALMAAGVALEALEIPEQDGVRLGLALMLVLLGAASSSVAFVRWARAELALRQSKPLPSPVLTPLLALGLAVAGIAVVIALIAS